MEAPTCRICGHKHWDRVCTEFAEDHLQKPVTPAVTVTRRVTPPVTATVTPRSVPRLVAPSKLAALEVENRALRGEVERLTIEVERLKVLLANEHWKTPGNKIAVTPKERMRAMRDRRKTKT